MYKSFKTGLLKIMSLTMLSTMSFGFIPQNVGAEEIKGVVNVPLSIEAKEQILNKISPNIIGIENKLNENKDPDEILRVIDELEGKLGIKLMDKGEKLGQEEINIVEKSHKTIKESIEALENKDIRHSYKNVINELSLDIKKSEINKIESIDEIFRVIETTEYNPEMNNKRKEIKVEEAWKNYSLKGEGTAAAIIDSGVGYDHKGFMNQENKSKERLNKQLLEKIKQSGIMHIDKNTENYFSDKFGGSLIPAIYLMRNAKEIKAEILNDKGEVVRKIGTIEAIKKQISAMREIRWDGQVYNEETKQLEIAKEGQYTYKLTITIGFEGAKEQTLEVPIKIDITAPEVNILKYEKLGDNEFKIYFNVNDNISKFDNKNTIPILINGELNEEATKQEAVYDKDKGAFYKILKGLEDNTFNEITVGAFDNAKNFGASSIAIKIGDVAPAKVEVDGLEISTEVEPMIVDKNEIAVTGKVSRKIKSLKIGGNEVEFSKSDENGIVKFSYDLKLKQGFNTVNIRAEDFDGKVIIDYGGKFICDTINPTISITNPEVKGGKIYTNGKSQIILKGIVYDNLNNYEFYADGELIKKEIIGGYNNTEINRYNFELRYDNVKNGQNINLKVIDDVGNKTEVNLTVVK